MLMERGFDPEESMFKVLTKIVNREGKMHDTILRLIAKNYLAKLEADISDYSEFLEHFIILFTRCVAIISNSSIQSTPSTQRSTSSSRTSSLLTSLVCYLLNSLLLCSYFPLVRWGHVFSRPH